MPNMLEVFLQAVWVQVVWVLRALMLALVLPFWEELTLSRSPVEEHVPTIHCS
jgi:hypothetical protein